ncbi:hypothetical protein [Shinella sp. JR1-6]|uniref:hypothetical protein n=1 Tax=Shinella sp. JR1-6 TaxID=2527671 RepID=UPI00102D4703|nr:hypothetical protein [Shinella sp. JR1-6]TAA54637.1 hypothetical protein EXZ48_26800 [Shinella sp. JR1-6]
MPVKLTESIKLNRNTFVDVALLTKILLEIQAHLDPLEILKDGLEAAIKQYAAFVRERTDLILGPKMDEIAEKLLDLTTMISTARADLEAGAEHALDQIQPQITAKLAEVTTAISGLNTAISQANAARDGANTAAGAANTAAAGVNTAIADQIRGAEYFARWIAG